MQRTLLAAGLTCLTLAAGNRVKAEDQAEASRIVAKAIDAHGGAAKLAKLKAVEWKSKGTFHGPMGPGEFTTQVAVQFPDKSRFDVSAGDSFGFISVLNGDKGWAKFGEDHHEMDEGAINEVKENLYAMWLTTVAPLADKALTLKPLGESKIDERPVVGVLVSQAGHRDVSLYFDKETGLLAKMATRSKDLFQGGKEIDSEEFYSDYKEFGGVKRPTKVKGLKDGKTAVEETRSDYKLSEKLDDKTFEKPS